MKFILFVEGKTEAQSVSEFLNRWFSSSFESGARPGVQVKKFKGLAELHDRAPKIAVEYLTDPAYKDVIAVVSLLDLYGPQFYPEELMSASDRYEWGTQYMEDRFRQYVVGRGLPETLSAKYRHFFAVHEIEAWFLTRPELFHKDVRERLLKQKPPEEINFDLHPGKLLERLYITITKHKYDKTVNARNIFPRLDPADTAEKCPYLKAMLMELREMARLAGARPIGSWTEGGG